MVGTLADKVAGLLDPRFRLTIWASTVIFAVALGGIVVLGVGWQASVAWWRAAGTEGQVVLAVLAFAAVTLLAFLLSASLMSILRFLEGYWDHLPAGKRFAARRRAHHRDHLTALDPTTDQATMYYFYPPAVTLEYVMPTRLGNILRAAEVHPKLRYGIESAIAWPRLYTVLPDAFTTSFATAKSQVDMMAIWTVLSAAFAVIGGALAAALLPWYAALACVWIGALLCVLAYNALLQSAVPYAELIKSAFDVHRKAVLETIGWRSASSLGGEVKQWTAITQLWYQITPSEPQALGYPEEPGAAPVPVPDPEPLPEPDPAPDAVPAIEDNVAPFDHLARWLSVAVIAFGVLLALIAYLRGEPAPARYTVVAARSLPVYYQLTASDLARGTARAAAPGTAFTSAGQLVGRYTVAPIGAGALISSAALGPRIDPGRLAGTEPVELGSGGARFPAGLERGDQVEVLVRARRRAYAWGFEIDGLIVLNVGRAPGAIVLAVPAHDERWLVRAAAAGMLVVTRQR